MAIEEALIAMESAKTAKITTAREESKYNRLRKLGVSVY